MMRADYLKRFVKLLPFAMPIIAAVLLAAAWPAYEQQQELQLAIGQQKQQLDLLLQFKNEHHDYAAYRAQLQQQMQKLRRQLPQQLDRNAVINEVQQLAASNAILLREVKAVTNTRGKVATESNEKTKNQERMDGLQVHLNLQGDYYNVLSWMRQVERQGWYLQKVNIKGDDKCGSILLEVCVVAYTIK